MRTNSARAFALADLIVRTALQSEKRGLILSIDVGGSFFDLIASNAADSLGFELVQSRTRLWRNAYRAGLPAMTSSARVVSEPVSFGRVDGSMHVSEARSPYNFDGLAHERAPTRSIDGWSGGRLPFSLIHFGDQELTQDQIVGAFTTITTDRPVLTFYPARGDRRGLLRSIDALGYRVFDLAGRTAAADCTEAETDFGWIALPEDKVGIVENCASRQLDESDLSGSSMPRQWRLRDALGLPANALIVKKMQIPAKDIIGVSDVYPLENEGTHSWRWLGPRPRSRIAIPCPLPGLYKIELEITGCHLETGLAGSRILAEGREVQAEISDAIPAKIAFVGQLPASGYAGYMEVDIVNGGTTRATKSDSRTLRICVQSVNISLWQ